MRPWFTLFQETVKENAAVNKFKNNVRGGTVLTQLKPWICQQKMFSLDQNTGIWNTNTNCKIKGHDIHYKTLLLINNPVWIGKNNSPPVYSWLLVLRSTWDGEIYLFQLLLYKIRNFRNASCTIECILRTFFKEMTELVKFWGFIERTMLMKISWIICLIWLRNCFS